MTGKYDKFVMGTETNALIKIANELAEANRLKRLEVLSSLERNAMYVKTHEDVLDLVDEDKIRAKMDEIEEDKA